MGQGCVDTHYIDKGKELSGGDLKRVMAALHGLVDELERRGHS
jgi:hypothetical protein